MILAPCWVWLENSSVSGPQVIVKCPEILLGLHTYCMDFNSWLLRRQKLLPQSDRLVALIQQAGPNGIPEGQLRSAVDLPMKLFDDLIQALVSARQVAVVERGGKRWYVAR